MSPAITWISKNFHRPATTDSATTDSAQIRCVLDLTDESTESFAESMQCPVWRVPRRPHATSPHICSIMPGG